MTQRLHLVFGGELLEPSMNVFKDVENLHIVGMFPDYDTAYNAWKAEAQKSVDNAHMRYFIAHLHRLRDEEVAASATEELG
ncbi:hypothetical protein ROA7450_01904 [Roseovarius albus]|uniref:Inositol monophosphatase family protein n=1 Tax=Roseovarius albus TaxID=1247867 RepID=A0A1X6Z4Q8_9RHOB|nr:DUF4170 domain-containing protein [Roseovarius albus]SLN39973.1 hypothetical protein ROA7450_01904 [Roseovarius albus]